MILKEKEVVSLREGGGAGRDVEELEEMMMWLYFNQK